MRICSFCPNKFYIHSDHRQPPMLSTHCNTYIGLQIMPPVRHIVKSGVLKGISSSKMQIVDLRIVMSSSQFQFRASVAASASLAATLSRAVCARVSLWLFPRCSASCLPSLPLAAPEEALARSCKSDVSSHILSIS